MLNGARPADDNVNGIILLYKKSGSNLARDFYVLPFYNFTIISTLQDPSFSQFLNFGDYEIAIDVIRDDAIEYSDMKFTDNSRYWSFNIKKCLSNGENKFT